MFEIRPIQSLDLPELAPYRTMRLQKDHRSQGFFVVEGEKVVRRLLASDFKIISLLLPERWVDEFCPLLERYPERIPIYAAKKTLLEKLTGYSLYQGVLWIH